MNLTHLLLTYFCLFSFAQAVGPLTLEQSKQCQKSLVSDSWLLENPSTWKWISEADIRDIRLLRDSAIANFRSRLMKGAETLIKDRKLFSTPLFRPLSFNESELSVLQFISDLPLHHRKGQLRMISAGTELNILTKSGIRFRALLLSSSEALVLIRQGNVKDQAFSYWTTPKGSRDYVALLNLSEIASIAFSSKDDSMHTFASLLENRLAIAKIETIESANKFSSGNEDKFAGVYRAGGTEIPGAAGLVKGQVVSVDLNLAKGPLVGILDSLVPPRLIVQLNDGKNYVVTLNAASIRLMAAGNHVVAATMPLRAGMELAIAKTTTDFVKGAFQEVLDTGELVIQSKNNAPIKYSQAELRKLSVIPWIFTQDYETEFRNVFGHLPWSSSDGYDWDREGWGRLGEDSANFEYIISPGKLGFRFYIYTRSRSTGNSSQHFDSEIRFDGIRDTAKNLASFMRENVNYMKRLLPGLRAPDYVAAEAELEMKPSEANQPNETFSLVIRYNGRHVRRIPDRSGSSQCVEEYLEQIKKILPSLRNAQISERDI